MGYIYVTLGNGAERRLVQNGISVQDIETWTREFLARLGLRTLDLGEIRCLPGQWDARSTYGQFDPAPRRILVFLPEYLEARDLKATLIHELTHLAQLLRKCQFQIPETGEANWGSWEFAVLYYATSRTEMEALAWEVTVFPERYRLLKEAMRIRLQMTQRR